MRMETLSPRETFEAPYEALGLIEYAPKFTTGYSYPSPLPGILILSLTAIVVFLAVKKALR